jgi:hypothetical protein
MENVCSTLMYTISMLFIFINIINFYFGCYHFTEMFASPTRCSIRCPYEGQITCTCLDLIELLRKFSTRFLSGYRESHPSILVYSLLFRDSHKRDMLAYNSCSLNRFLTIWKNGACGRLAGICIINNVVCSVHIGHKT